MHRPLERLKNLISALAVLITAAVMSVNSGCASPPILPPPVITSSGMPEWQLGPGSLTLYESSSTRRGSFLSLRYSTDFPHPLGETFVTDLAIVIKNPVAGRYQLPDDSVQARLARPAEIANARTGLIVATGGIVMLEDQGDAGFSGAAKLEFTDTLHGDARYLVIARFRPPSR